MRQLLDLPNETLLQIIAPTNIEDIDSFASCNKHMRLLFGPILQPHMEKKRKHSLTELGQPNSRIGSPHAVMLLCDVLQSPDIAHYPMKIVIGDCVDRVGARPDWSFARRMKGMTEIRDAIAQCTDLLSAKLDDCPYIKKSDMQDWKQEICAGNERTAVAFLITLFPNLKSIIISDASSHPNRLLEVVSKIAAVQQKIPESFHALQKLATVRLEGSSEAFYTHYDLFKPFAALKSVRKLAGTMVQSWECDWDNEDEDKSDDERDKESEDAVDDEFDYEDEIESSNNGKNDDQSEDDYDHKGFESGGGITNLSFKDSAINAQSFETVLKGTKALRKFEHIFEDSFDGEGEWEPAAILRGLLTYAVHSLVSLRLIGTKGPWDVCVGDCLYLTHCPRHFQVLKRLYVQEGIFVEEKGVLDPPQPTKKPFWSIKTAASRIYRMVDILPASLEHLTLYPSFDHRGQITNAFQGFPELKEHSLPRLNDITLAGGLKLDESMKLACKKAGTSVEES